MDASSIQDKELLPLTMDSKDKWQAPIVRNLHDEVELTSKEEAQKLRYRASHYVLIDNMMYKQGYSLPLLRCLDCEEADYMLKETHERICDNHFTSHLLSHKVLSQGYY